MPFLGLCVAGRGDEETTEAGGCRLEQSFQSIEGRRETEDKGAGGAGAEAPCQKEDQGEGRSPEAAGSLAGG